MRVRKLGSRLAPGIALVVGVLSIGVSRTARAAGPLEDQRAFPEAPRPPTLPELTHPDGEATLELTTGAFTPRGTSALRGHVPVQVLRTAVEQPIAGRRWFLGAALDGALAQPETNHALKPLIGNPELTVRALWATSTGMSFGGGFTFFVPLAGLSRSGEAHDIATAATTLRPWDLSAFAQGFFTVRPFFDVRDVFGRLVLQLREAVDVAFDVQGGEGYRMFAVGTGYVGYRVAEAWAVGLEVSELYVIESAVSDERRAFFTLSPGVRGIFPRVQPQLGFITNVGPPYYPGTRHMTALRVGVTVLF